MKSTGIVRKIDKLGRIVLPAEMRKIFNLIDRDALEMFTEDDMIILKKYGEVCSFCGSSVDLTVFKGKNICSKCAEELKSV